MLVNRYRNKFTHRFGIRRDRIHEKFISRGVDTIVMLEHIVIKFTDGDNKFFELSDTYKYQSLVIDDLYCVTKIEQGKVKSLYKFPFRNIKSIFEIPEGMAE